MSKKLLFVTARLPYPPVSGRKNVMYYYCKYLHERYGYEIINVSFLEENDDISKKPDFIKKTYPLDNPSGGAKIRNLIINTVIKKTMPMQVSLYYDNSINNIIDNIVSEEKPDLLMCDMIRTSEYLKKYEAYKIMDMDDMLSVRYKRQLQADVKNINPYGAYLYKLPKLLQNILLFNPLKKFVMKFETKLIEKYEINISNNYDVVVFVAQREAEELNNKLNYKKAFAVPLGVDVDYFINNNDNNIITNSISYIGAMSVAHNESAVIYFCEKILPLIINEIPDVKFYIIGGGVTDKIKKLKSDNVIITGRVEDIREYATKTQVFVCPLLFGSGIKTKNLEAMSMGIPVVTTSVGAESISAVNNEDWIIADGVMDFKNAVVKVLKDSELQNKLSDNGSTYVRNNFSWEKVMDNWEEVFDYIYKK